MKNTKSILVCVLLAGLLLAACAPAPSPTPTAVPPTPTPSFDYIGLVQDFWAAANEGDGDTAASYLSEDATFSLHLRFQRHLHTEPIIGAQAIGDYLVSEQWQGITVEGSNFSEENGRVVYNCKIYSGGHLLASGSTTSNSACVVVAEEGKIVFVGDQAEELLYRGEE